MNERSNYISLDFGWVNKSQMATASGLISVCMSTVQQCVANSCFQPIPMFNSDVIQTSELFGVGLHQLEDTSV